jgi:hypothetical protein
MNQIMVSLRRFAAAGNSIRVTQGAGQKPGFSKKPGF